MAAPTITQVVEAIESALETISGLRTAEYVPDQVNPPMAIVDFPGDIDYHAAFANGLFTFEPTVIILVSKVVDRVGTAALAAYASPTGTNSIKVALEADKTLGGVVDDCHVVSFRRLTAQETVDIAFYGGVFTLRVYAKGV